MADKPAYRIPTVKDARLLPSRGPWTTKSEGQLSVQFQLASAELDAGFLHYEESELTGIARDIRGLRSYRVSGLKRGSIGAHEWHRVRNELVSVIEGSVKWTCQDAYGDTVEFTLDQTSSIWVPPFILHTYEALEDHTHLQVVASTTFSPDDPATHDTYSAADFKQFQTHYQAA